VRFEEAEAHFAAVAEPLADKDEDVRFAASWALIIEHKTWPISNK
jgi:hypothetical protein